MKKFMMAAALAATVGALVVGQIYAATGGTTTSKSVLEKAKARREKLKKRKTHKPAPNGKAGPVVFDPNVDVTKGDAIDKNKVDIKDKGDLDKLVLGELTIQSFTAVREGTRIKLWASVTNESTATLRDMVVKFFQLKGGKWQLLNTDSISLPAKRPQSVSTEMPASNETMRFKVEVSGNSRAASKQVSLAARKVTFVLQFRPQGKRLVWEEANEVDRDKLTGKAADDLRKELNSYGFKTEKKVEHNTAIFGDDSFHIWLWAWNDQTLEWTFDTAEERSKFKGRVAQVFTPRGSPIPPFATFKQFER